MKIRIDSNILNKWLYGYVRKTKKILTIFILREKKRERERENLFYTLKITQEESNARKGEKEQL